MLQPGYTLPLDSGEATLERVGGKGASLSRLAQAGLPVPPGFHVTTAAYRQFVAVNQLQARILALASAAGDDPSALEAASEAIRGLFLAAPIPDEIAAAIRAAYNTLAHSDTKLVEDTQHSPLSTPVAVRSSATAEDLPDASFAGQQDTYLNIIGAEQVVDAVRWCWASLWTARAMGYRAHHAIDNTQVSLAVVVQTLVPAEAAGILFTANPVTGHRGQVVIDGAWGLGEAVVGGLVTPDHWIVDKATGAMVSTDIRAKAVMTVRTRGGTEEAPVPDAQRDLAVLTPAQVSELTRLATYIETIYGTPQDIEWAVAGDKLYILQSRPITSLYPQPAPLPMDGEVHAYFNFNYLQGLVEPITPAGVSFFRELVRSLGQTFGTRLVADGTQPSVFNPVAGRLFVDVTTPLRSPRAVRLLRGITAMMDPRMGQALSELQADPRLSPRPDQPLLNTLLRLQPLAIIPRTILPRVFALWVNPDGARRRYLALAHSSVAELHQRIAAAQSLDERLAVLDSIPALFGFLGPRLVPMVASGVILQGIAGALVKRWLGDTTGVLSLLRGVPHNPTTTMDLSLWQLSRHIAVDTAAVKALRRPTAEVVADYQAQRLPPPLQVGLGSFLAIYGHRAIREIDLGLPRWSEAPGYIIDVVRTYLDITDPGLAPDVHFRQGAVAGEAGIQSLLDRLRGTPWGRLRRRVLGVVLTRMRALVGLREMPKFMLVRMLAEIRALWWAMGRDLQSLGVVEQAEDIFFLTVDEVRAVGKGQRASLAGLVANRRGAYQTEMRRRRVPRAITSEGVELYGGATVDGATALNGTGASPGVVEGVVRVVLDPHGAQLQPGEILVAPSTDPAWTPLFLTAAGLVMEAGGVMSHGSVVAREYGIPAVVGLADATHILRTGQRVTVDGTRGRVILASG